MSDTLIIILAVIAVLIVGYVVFRSVSGAQTGALPATPAAKEDEGDGMADGFADATEELIGDFVGVDTHPGKPDEAPAVEAEPVAAPAARTGGMGAGDDLEVIKGLGGKIASELNARGITRYAQIAAWTEADIEALATRLGRENLAVRAGRDRWVEQAGLLDRGETAAFEEKFGKIG